MGGGQQIPLGVRPTPCCRTGLGHGTTTRRSLPTITLGSNSILINLGGMLLLTMQAVRHGTFVILFTCIFLLFLLRHNLITKCRPCVYLEKTLMESAHMYEPLSHRRFFKRERERVGEGPGGMRYRHHCISWGRYLDTSFFTAVRHSFL